MNIPRGIRNNNPGNIRHGEQWQGRANDQPDPDFATFVSPEYGIRAMAKVLMNYQERYGICTIRGIITRWAPPIENATDEYVQHVARRCGIAPDAKVIVAGILADIIPAIIQHENGQQPYSMETIRAGIDMARGEQARTHGAVGA